MNNRGNFDRREFLVSLAGAAAAARGLRAETFAPSGSPLREDAGRKGLLYGTALRGALDADPQYANLVATQCSLVVPEGALKWDTLRPSAEQFDFSEADAYLKFAQAKNIHYRGHTLVWHEALPSWFKSTVNATNAKKFLLEHISAVAGRYAGKMHSWDVVNEVVEVRDLQVNGLRNTPWFRLVGPDYVELAFRAAHEADPHALLVYNEDQLEPETLHSAIKRRYVLSLLKDLKKKNVPIHALGLESHIPARGAVCGEGLKEFLQEVSDLGLLIILTEMDVSDQTMPAAISARDALVARRYFEYLSTVLQFAPVCAVLTWGLTDRYTWLSQHNPRPDGLPVRPLPFDAECRPAKAKDAISRAFEQAPARLARIRDVNGFLGPSV